MPRGIPNKKRRGRRAAPENGSTEATEVDEEGNPVVGGELAEPPPTLGEAIEIVRSALESFDDPTRRKVVRAATMLLK